MSLFSNIKKRGLTPDAKPVMRWLIGTGGIKRASLFALFAAATGGYAFSRIEHETVWHGFFWAVTTMTTLGYNEQPITSTVTEVLALILLFVGIGFVAIMTGSIAERFVRVDTSKMMKLEDQQVAADSLMLQELHKISEEIALLKEQLPPK